MAARWSHPKATCLSVGGACLRPRHRKNLTQVGCQRLAKVLRIGEAAKPDIAGLAELRDKLRQAGDAYWSEQVDIQWQVATAWMLSAENKHDEALATMKDAADAEDKTEKSIVTPGPLAPARDSTARCCSASAWQLRPRAIRGDPE